jgi:hypothetical protein
MCELCKYYLLAILVFNPNAHIVPEVILSSGVDAASQFSIHGETCTEKLPFDVAVVH